MGLYKEIDGYAKRLASAAKWNASKKAISHVFESKEESNYVYEFYVLIKLLENLSNNYILEYVPDPENQHQFPKAAAQKKNYPFFKAFDLVRQEELRFQICAGTEVINDFNNACAPDISFQKPSASMNPRSSDLILIIDAKHKKDSNGRISADDVKVFAHDVACFEIDSASYEVNFHGELSNIDRCAIITNAKPHLDSDLSLEKFKCIIVYNFTPATAHLVLR